MNFNKSNSDKSEVIFYQEHKNIDIQNQENANYLYPNGHRITHQMKWFKVSRDMV